MDKVQIKKEIEFRTSRSGGKGGQNVNKVETKVEVRLHIFESHGLTDYEKKILQKQLAPQLTTEGELICVNQTERSQLANKIAAEAKLFKLLEINLRKRKKRVPTGVPKAVRESIRTQKKVRSVIKASRKKLRPGDL